MGRNKVKLAWIDDDCARRASLKKRRLGLLKKISELSTLCGIEACLIIYSPGESEPLVWPSHAEVQRQLQQFCEMPELERLKNMMNQETFLGKRVTKEQEQLRKFQRRNKEVEMGHLMRETDQGNALDQLIPDELQRMSWFVEERMKEIQNRIEVFHQVPFASPAGHLHGDLPLLPQGLADDLTAQIGTESGGFGVDHGRTTAQSLLSDKWFINMIKNYEYEFGGYMGLPCQPFAGIAAQDLGLSGHTLGGNSTVAADMGLPLYENFRGPTVDTGLSPSGFRLHGGASDIGHPHGGGSNTFGPFGIDIGLGLHPFSLVGSSSTGTELGLPFWPFEGVSSSSAGNDIGKSWPNNFFN